VIQSNTAAHEIMHLDQQIAAAEIQEAIAKNENRNHEQQQEHAREVEEFLRDKYTNRELYNWMVGQISAMYFQAYQFTYDVANVERIPVRARPASSNFIQFGYWDSLRKGLLAGDRLYHDLKRMEVAYLDQNRREHEMTKHVSLSAAPEALVELRGQLFRRAAEALFDVDCPGHYMRRLKSVGELVRDGPYTEDLQAYLLGNRIRRHEDLALMHGGFETAASCTTAAASSRSLRAPLAKTRAVRLTSATNAIFRSSSGAISGWRIELPSDFRQLTAPPPDVINTCATRLDGGGVLRRGDNQLATALKIDSTRLDRTLPRLQCAARLSTIGTGSCIRRTPTCRSRGVSRRSCKPAIGSTG
jgi:hypothetical protein